MPVAGAMDFFAYTVANLLVGNDGGEAALEFTFKGPEMEFLEDAVVALTGADAAPLTDDGEPLPRWRSFLVSKGSIIGFGGLKTGLRGYIAVRGGIDVPLVLGSRSTYLRAKTGGLNGRKLAPGDVLNVGDSKVSTGVPFAGRGLPRGLIPRYESEAEVRVILGPQDELFGQESIEVFLSSVYEVTPQSDRMGYRLQGPPIKHKEQAELISDGIPPGAVQVPENGQPIIMLADRQATGGYAKIATVISVDIDKIAQLKPGDKIKFVKTTPEEAKEARIARHKIFEGL
jgi:antagonist of KipI